MTENPFWDLSPRCLIKDTSANSMCNSLRLLGSTNRVVDLGLFLCSRTSSYLRDLCNRKPPSVVNNSKKKLYATHYFHCLFVLLLWQPHNWKNAQPPEDSQVIMTESTSANIWYTLNDSTNIFKENRSIVRRLELTDRKISIFWASFWAVFW